jgi:carboxyl-terminal processing protease
LYLTVQKFYRVTGGSTQLRGVIPDVKLPSVLDNAEYGESALNHPLVYDHIEPVPIDLAGNRKELFKSELRERSAARLRHDPQFQTIAKDVRQLNERLKSNRLSLNEATRRTEMAKDTKQQENEEAERRNAERTDQSNTYELNLAYVNKPNLPLLKKTLATAKPAPRSYNPVDAALDEGAESDRDKSGPAKKEALNILSDLIGFSKSSRAPGR